MKWKTIDTLPSTGESVLMALRSGDIVIAPASMIEEATTPQKRQIYEATGEWPNAKFQPTHWMPLPDPPGSTSTQGDR